MKLVTTLIENIDSIARRYAIMCRDRIQIQFMGERPCARSQRFTDGGERPVSASPATNKDWR